ncbi:MAG TPA: heavy metal translocating P-type ATPase metal-binding domain-containing protein [Opitutaceae bacterium]|nr:heavy metal translocating P-type ATPase metal-binding domain-containing protein [Opitutaceae bacterium]
MGVLLKSPAKREAAPAGRGASQPVRGRNCLHCGIPTRNENEAFCCSGCAYVHRLIHDEGLENYYRIKNPTTIPADGVFLAERGYEWLRDAQRASESEVSAQAGSRGSPELRVDVQGISCAGCVWLIDRLFQKQRGAGRIEVNAQSGQMRFTWEAGLFDAGEFGRTLQKFNYLLSPASAPRSAPSESSRLVRRIGLAAACSMNVMLFTLPSYFGMESTFTYARLFATLSLGFATLCVFGAGEYFIVKAVRSIRERILSIDVPIALGILGAYAGSTAGWWLREERYVYFDFVSTFILLMLVGRWAQLVAVERNQRRLLAEQPTPDRIRVASEKGEWRKVSPEALKRGDRFLLGSGQMLPVEARLLSDSVEMNLSWINGESEPRVFRAGQRVPSGAMNVGREDGRFTAIENWSSSLLNELTKPSQRIGYRHKFLERVVQGYLVAILAAASTAGATWWWTTGDLLKSGAVITAVLVVSCPCAIGLAFPLAEEIATVALRRRGVFVRDAQLWPRLRRVKNLVFDKTGTLTLETPTLRNPRALQELNEAQRRALITLVRDTLHPVARSLHEALLERAVLEPLPVDGVREVVGQGVSLEHGGRIWKLGRADWAMSRAPFASSSDENNEVCFACDGREIASFSFTESLRFDAIEELQALRRRGLTVSVLSGDKKSKVNDLVGRLGLDPQRAHAEMTPREKASWLEREGGVSSLILGDGANDSLAFDRALCRGTPVVHRGVLAEKADFYYLGRGIGGVRALFEIDDARRRTHNALLVFSVAYNLCAVGLAATGHMSPLLAAILMPVSSLATLGIVALGMRGVRGITLQS